MGASKTKIMNLLEMRFDYQSARNVVSNWHKSAGIKGDPDNLDDVQLRSLLDYLKTNAADATRVHDAIERLILTEDKPAEQPPVIEEHAEEAPAVEEMHAEEEQAGDAPAEDAGDAPDADRAEDHPADNGKKKKKGKK